MSDRGKADRYVLDGSAVLALINGEPGADRVAAVLDRSVVSAVNYAEVVTKLVEKDLPLDVVARILDPLHLRVIDFDKPQAVRAGGLRGNTRYRGLSAGDRACLALAATHKAAALTTDPRWDGDETEISVEQLRPLRGSPKSR